uniref:Uncharacterized protein n=1 Tax=Anguilla anguilla TaxID=7936 RepID=A0A0E9WEG6_ANGAN
MLNATLQIIIHECFGCYRAPSPNRHTSTHQYMRTNCDGSNVALTSKETGGLEV